jgi:hypothetical protein
LPDTREPGPDGIMGAARLGAPDGAA